jgi:hypothetical protein
VARSPKRGETKAGAKAQPSAAAERVTSIAASHLIDDRIRSLRGWRGESLARVRRLVHEADPDIMEGCKRRISGQAPRNQRAVAGREPGVTLEEGVSCRPTSGCSGRPAARPAGEPERRPDQTDGITKAEHKWNNAATSRWSG